MYRNTIDGHTYVLIKFPEIYPNGLPNASTRIQPVYRLIKELSKLDLRLLNKLEMSVLPAQLMEQINSMKIEEGRILVLNTNRQLVGDTMQITKWAKAREPFVSVSNGSSSVAFNENFSYATFTPFEAFRLRNYLLCLERDKSVPVKQYKSLLGSQSTSSPPSTIGEHGITPVVTNVIPYYRCSKTEEDIKWHAKPPYVNMDRSEDSLGSSSWNGNLVRWLGSGFGTRMQFGIQAGLFPDP